MTYPTTSEMDLYTICLDLLNDPPPKNDRERKEQFKVYLAKLDTLKSENRNPLIIETYLILLHLYTIEGMLTQINTNKDLDLFSKLEEYAKAIRSVNLEIVNISDKLRTAGEHSIALSIWERASRLTTGTGWDFDLVEESCVPSINLN